VIVCFVDIGVFDGHCQKESVNSNGDQFHQNQQNKQSSLNLTH
jgi:hypothetical protein